MEKNCTTCGQRLPEIRLGARLTELKATIFDAIKIRGAHGIQTIDLLQRDDLLGLTRQSLKSHVHQINELIEDSGFRIYGRGPRNQNRDTRACDGVGTWRLEKTRAQQRGGEHGT